jgi:hypothetical protein
MLLFFENTLHASTNRHPRESGDPLPENPAIANRYWKWIRGFRGDDGGGRLKKFKQLSRANIYDILSANRSKGLDGGKARSTLKQMPRLIPNWIQFRN